MLKAKKSKSSKQMSEALKEVSKEDGIGIYFSPIPRRLYWKFTQYISAESKNRGCVYQKREWLIEQLEKLPETSDK